MFYGTRPNLSGDSCITDATRRYSCSVQALSPRAIRTAAEVSETAAARQVGVSRVTLRMYEACPDFVKTPAKRWLLDRYYDGLRGFLASFAEQRRLVAEGRYEPDEPTVAVAA